jgi:hypothetical protein
VSPRKQSDEKHSVIVVENREKINRQPGLPKFDFKTQENLTYGPIDIEFCTFDNQPENLFVSTNQINSAQPSTDLDRVLPSLESPSNNQNPFGTLESPQPNPQKKISAKVKPILVQSQKTDQNPDFPVNNKYSENDFKNSSKETSSKQVGLGLDLSTSNLGGNKKKNVQFSGREC